jgi:hypothetical protein
MTNKEQIKRDLAITFDFVEQIVEDPDLSINLFSAFLSFLRPVLS